MKKLEFISELESKLKGLPEREVKERVSFYSEMIDDIMEDGTPEAAAVLSVGRIEDIVVQIIEGIAASGESRERIKKKKRKKAWEIVLIVLGSPIWFSLLVAALAIVLSLYISLWAIVVSLWSAFVAIAVSSPAAGILSVVSCFSGSIPLGVVFLGAGLFLGGLAIFAFYGCIALTKASCKLFKYIIRLIKKCFGVKENI